VLRRRGNRSKFRLATTPAPIYRDQFSGRPGFRWGWWEIPRNGAYDDRLKVLGSAAVTALVLVMAAPTDGFAQRGSKAGGGAASPRHLRPVRPSDVATAIMRLLQCGHRVGSKILGHCGNRPQDRLHLAAGGIGARRAADTATKFSGEMGIVAKTATVSDLAERLA
jgi:hypothetical protein